MFVLKHSLCQRLSFVEKIVVLDKCSLEKYELRDVLFNLLPVGMLLLINEKVTFGKSKSSRLSSRFE